MRNIVLVVGSLLVAAFGLEAFLRLTHAFGARVAWTEPDPEIGYRFTPGASYWFFRENDHPVQGRINALGWRDYERTREKPPGVTRVAVLGDSYVEAFQVELDSTFAAIAERRLHARGMNVEIMNFGRSDMGTAEELIVLERDILPCRPDVVVIVFTPSNDVADIHPRTATHGLRPFPRLDARGEIVVDTGFAGSDAYRTRERINGLKQRSALLSFIAERYNVWRRAPDGGDGASPRGSDDLAPLLSLCTASPDSLFEAGYALSKRLLARMIAACRERGVDVVLASVPTGYTDASVAQARDRDATFDPGFFDTDLGALADTTGASMIRLTAIFRGYARATDGSLNWAHWNYRGHRVVADELAASLQERAGR